MELVANTEAFTDTEMLQINRCHLFFRALTLANVITSDGAKITQVALSLDRSSLPQSQYDFANEWPCQADRNVWKRALC